MSVTPAGSEPHHILNDALTGLLHRFAPRNDENNG